MGAFGGTSPRSLARGTPRSAGEFPLVQGVYTATGVRIPPGSLDRWFAGRGAASGQLVEVALYGDSTMFGQTLSGPYYSPLQRIRERLISAGYADGGHGNLNGVDDVTSAADSLSVAAGFASGNAFVLTGESKYSDVSGDAQTFTRAGRYLTIWYVRFNTGGRFTYEIDGSGVEVPIDPVYPTAGGVSTFAHTSVIDLGTDATHTITVRNKGGRILSAPSYTGGTGTGSGTGGTLAAGTYDYAAAFVSPGGKIGPLGPTRTITITSGQTYTISLLAQPEGSGTTTNVYRRVSGVGSFQLLGNVATNASSPYVFTDSGGAATTTYAQDAPPVLNSTMPWVCVSTSVTKAAGIVLHNFAARGSASGMAAGDFNLALGLGLDLDPQATAAIARNPDVTSGAHHPSLVILTHGINDQQGSPSDNSPTLQANTVTAIRAARHAGSDVLVTIPAFESAANQSNAPLYRAALKAAANGENAPWVDIGMGGALPALTSGITTNPHLTQAQYQTQGDFIWDQVLGLT